MEKSNSKLDELTIVVGSCDKYSFLWPKFIERFNRFWDHEITIDKYIMTETYNVKSKEFKTLKCGDVPYTEFLKNGLKNIEEKYILWLQDDYFLVNKLNSEIIKNCYDLIKKQENIIRVGIHPNSKYYTTFKEKDSKFKKFSKNSMYSVSMQSSIWNRKKLIDFLSNSPNESPWQFEINGSQRLNNTKHEVVFYELEEDWYQEAMKKGKKTEIYYE